MFFTNNSNDNLKESCVEMDINAFITITESLLYSSDDEYYITTEAAASWEALKIDFSDIKKESKKHWKEAKKLEKKGEYKEALKLYDKAITEAKSIYKIIDKIPDENLMDFLAGYIPYISYTLWGIILVGTITTGKIKGASRAYAKKVNDNFIAGLMKKRNECLEKSKNK